MKKIISLLVLAFCFPAFSFGQNCTAFMFNKGQKLSYEIKSYPLTMESDPSMITGDTRYKVKKSIEHNEKIASGKIVAKKTTTLVATINNVTEANGRTIFDFSTEGLSTPVPYKYYCGKDSLVSAIYNGRFAYALKGDTTAVMFFGAINYPAQPIVGSRIKGCTNLSVFSSKDELPKLRKLIYSEFNPATKSPAEFYETTTNVTGPIKSTILSITLNQPALVIREEKLTFSGKDYTAYVLGTESWTMSKAKVDGSFYELETKYLQLPDMSKKILVTPSYEAGGKRLWKKESDGYIDTNKYDFSLTYKEEWLVPGLGVVKSVSYDANGAIMSVSELKSVN